MAKNQKPSRGNASSGNARQPKQVEPTQLTDEILHRILDEARVIVREQLLERSGENVFGLALDVFHFISDILGDDPRRGEYECCAGCSFCCYIPVSITAPEAILLTEAMRRIYSPDQLEEIQKVIAETDIRLNGMSGEQHARVKIPCSRSRS